MKKIKKIFCKIGLHKNRLVRQAGVYRYYECKRCEKRDFWQWGTGYSPLDRQWLNNKK